MSEKLIIPYGIARVSDANLSRVSKIEIDTAKSPPLRLGDGPYRRGIIDEEANDPPGDAEIGVGAARLDLLRRLHLRNCDVFDKYLRRWIDLYFAFVERQTEEFRDELVALARTPEAMFDPLLWGMAALRPLPRAHIPLNESEFVAVDVALWDGNQVIAVVFAGGEKDRRAQELGGWVRLISAEPPGDAAGPDVIEAQLGEFLSHFWRGLAVPPDPFGPAPFRLGAATAPSF
ncbi:MAG: hypothetical protein HKN28_05890 [Alphaproteobacteria bacterium]|nr:hypothetical protein [Alphaproteobacteria bacterium]